MMRACDPDGAMRAVTPVFAGYGRVHARPPARLEGGYARLRGLWARVTPLRPEPRLRAC